MLLFSFLVTLIDVRIAIFIALLLSIVGFHIVKKHSGIIYKISAITFVISLVGALFFFGTLTHLEQFVVVEIIFVLSLIGLRISRAKIVYRLAKQANTNVKSYLGESFRVAFLTQYGLSVHLLLILLLYVFDATVSHLVLMFTELFIFKVLLLTIIVMETVRLRILDKKLNKEEWLPIVSEDGAVSGKIAKSIIKDMKSRYMHPVVRIALVYDGKIYLQKRRMNYLLNPGMLDYPFEKYVLFEQDINTALKQCIQKTCGDVEIPLRFLLKYEFENKEVKRLILLYVSDIEDEALFNRLNLSDGKLWTQSQINDNMGTDIFSECFELEYEYLKNMVLLAKEHV
jgi:hypothetical protein